MKLKEKSVYKLTLRIIDCIHNLSCKSSSIRICVGHTLFDGLGFQMSIRGWLPISLRLTSCKIATCFSREWVGQEWRSWLEEKEDYNFDHNWFFFHLMKMMTDECTWSRNSQVCLRISFDLLDTCWQMIGRKRGLVAKKFSIVDLEINFNQSYLNVFCMINRRQTRPLVAMTW